MTSPILVTGASGLLGSALLRRFAAGGEVVGTRHRHGGAGLRPADLRERDEVRRLLEDTRPAAVVHAAACPEPDVCEADAGEARRLNVDPIRWLADCLPDTTPLVLISTDYVFGGDRAPYGEEDPVAPVNVYGQTKVEAERVLAGRPRSIVVRIPLQVGPPVGDRPGFIAQMRAQIERPEPALVDDVLIRVPTWTADVADAVAFLLSRGAEGIIHVSAPGRGTRWHWTQELARLMGRAIPHLRPSPEILPRRAQRPVDCQLRTQKLTALGWSRFTPFAAMARALGCAPA